MMKFRIGGDPEFPCLNRQGRLIPAWDVTTGRKGQTEEIDTGYTLHADNVALEGNFTPAEWNRFGSRINSFMSSVNVWLDEKGLVPWIVPETTEKAIYSFAPEAFMHPMANEYGCNPDHCAYELNPKAPRRTFKAEDMGRVRYYGGHIHLSYDADAARCPVHVMAKFLDLFLAIPAIASGVDKQGSRRKRYGIAGLYREKPYGIEYRTLSNFWLLPKNKYAHAGTIGNNIAQLLGAISDHKDQMVKLYQDMDWGKVREIIAEEEQEQANALVGALNVDMAKMGAMVYQYAP